MRVVCTAQLLGERFFAIGDTYEVEEDGSIMNDHGYFYTRENCDETEPLDYLKKWYTFEPVPEGDDERITFDDFCREVG